MSKGLKKSIAAFAVAAAVFTAAIASFAAPAADHASGESQVVGYFLDYIYEGT